ncbi:MAG: hypothetical protein P4L77_10905 [Sulfuriferula sp.]|nr:hypothetical protein [Sulfuriferula sp.]
MLETLLKNVPRICSTDAQLLMLEQYETLFGIYDHNKKRQAFEDPFAVVALHPAEDSYSYSLMRERMEQFCFHNVSQFFGCSWNEFLLMPACDAEEILQISARRKAKDDSNTGDIISQLGNIAGPPKPNKS